MTRFLAAVHEAIASGTFARLVLAQPAEAGLKSVRARRVQLKRGEVFQLVYRYADRDRTENIDLERVAAVLETLIEGFGTAHLYTTAAVLHLDRTRPGAERLSSGPPEHEAPPSAAHDREKQRAVALDPRWLEALGLARKDGTPVKGMEGKLRQVARFTEILDHWLPAPEQPGAVFHAVDVGSGRGWLTFAIWQTLGALGWTPIVTGVELRPALSTRTERVARSLGCAGLSFRSGAIADADLQGADLVVALHACDTATDDALALGVEAAARFVLVAPCCHRELRPQLAPPPVLRDIVRHGILLTREAEIATDALRASLLETAGYEARVFEFVSTDHTDKNLVIAATRRGTQDPAARDRARALASFWGITHQRLAERLGVPLVDGP